MQVEVVDKRRMSYENKRLSLSKVQIDRQKSGGATQNSVERLQSKALDKTPGQEKRSNNEDLSHKLAKAHEEFSNRKLGRKNAKEEIVQSIGIILRQKKGLSIDEEELRKDPTH